MNKKLIFLLISIAAIISMTSCSYETDIGSENGDYNEDWKMHAEIIKNNSSIYSNIEKDLERHAHKIDDPVVIKNPYGVVPLSAIVAFTTDYEASVKITVKGDTQNDTFTYESPMDKVHIIPIIGLYPSRENMVEINLMVDDNPVDLNQITISTDPLPDELLAAVSSTYSSEDPIKDFTVVSGGLYRNPYAFDSSGNIRWYLEVETDPHGYFPLSDDRFAIIAGYSMIDTETRQYAPYIFEMDFLGRLYKSYSVEKGAHHEVAEKKPNGNLLVLANSLEGHVEDTIIEIDRSTGKIIKELNFGNIIKDTPYNKAYDWAHINSLSYNAVDDSMVLSPRDISSAVKINWSNGDLIWILSDPAIWADTEYIDYVLKPIGDIIWHYEQHSVFEEKNIDSSQNALNLFMFDNHVIRNDLVDIEITEDAGRSAVVHYSIDESSKTVRQARRYPNSLAFITSNYNLHIENNRIIANHGSLRESVEDPIASMWGEIYEYNYSTGELVRSYWLKYGFYRAYSHDISDVILK